MRTRLALSRRSLLPCGGPDNDAVADEVSAERAYLGLDRAIDLGFAGFNAASNANIPDQSGPGDLGGTMTIGGQIDAGNSANKGMRLTLALADDYADAVLEGDIAIVYNGTGDLDMNFKGLPNAALDGTLVGTFAMTDVALDLSFTGTTEDIGDGTIRRAPGSILVKGTATSDYGVFTVDVAL